MRIRTFISPVSYRPNILRPDLTPAVINGKELCWLDSLLCGGLVIPEAISQFRRRPLIWLVSGPPGTGKTTFGLELCCRLSTTNQPEYGNQSLDTIYFSAESSTDMILEKMRMFGWPPPSIGFQIKGYEVVRNLVTAGDLFKLLPKRQARPGITDGMPGWHLVVVDSLNVLTSQLANSEWSPANLIKSIDEQMTGQAWILMLVQDWEHDQGRDPSYAFIADIETRFYEAPWENYLLNHFRIVKMRFQEHARGNHLVKIHSKPKHTDAPTENATRTVPASQAVGFEVPQGGIYVLPSIHRHLSGVAFEQLPRLVQEAWQVPVQGLDKIMPLGEGNPSVPLFGFPKRRCSALVGSRGAMKSHLAYLTLLRALEDPKTCGIMFTLRDDVRAAQDTLAQIANQENVAVELVEKCRSESRLDIVYFAPGYIPPEEFMHRVVVAIEGMIQRRAGEVDGRNIIAVLNGIDHLAARHPLCEAEDMFVPALISYLRKNRVTSLVIAANDDPRPIDDSGLLPMADLLLQFKTCGSRPLDLPTDAEQVTEVIAQRVPAGATSGGEGYMYRRANANGKLEFRAFKRRTDSMGYQSILLLPPQPAVMEGPPPNKT
jgi:KaiC/GvpD/RAD55 family RecA-like ATPase